MQRDETHKNHPKNTTLPGGVIRPCIVALLLTIALFGCGSNDGDAASDPTDPHAGHDHGPEGHDHNGHDHGEEEQPGIAVPRAVRDNLGIRFAAVQRRAVSQTMRVPGHFELLPTAMRDYHAPLTGRIELLVRQYDPVESGQVIARIDSPEWRELQSDLASANAAIQTAGSDVIVAEVAQREQQQLIELLEARVERLAAAEVRRIELENELAQAKLALPRLAAAVQAAKVHLEVAHAKLGSQLQLAASKTGIAVERLAAEGEGGVAFWRGLSSVPIVAKRAGVLDTLDVTDGRWVETGDHLATTIDPTGLRFRAEALQGDLPLLSEGLPVSIAPQGTVRGDAEPASATLVLGPTAHAADRTLVLYATPDAAPNWARPGIAGYLEITLDPDATEYRAIPSAAIVRDGVELIFFRRLPNNPDRVERLVADTGDTDGRWTEVYNNLAVGDQVVVEGVYQLLAATSTTIEQGGHFHADGTFHEGEDH